MEISNFELLLKPQSPATPSGSMAVDRVLQIVGRHSLHLPEQVVQRRVEVRRLDLLGRHRRDRRVGEDVHPHDVRRVDVHLPLAQVAGDAVGHTRGL